VYHLSVPLEHVGFKVIFPGLQEEYGPPGLGLLGVEPEPTFSLRTLLVKGFEHPLLLTMSLNQ
jgi:hypothetical protein